MNEGLARRSHTQSLVFSTGTDVPKSGMKRLQVWVNDIRTRCKRVSPSAASKREAVLMRQLREAVCSVAKDPPIFGQERLMWMRAYTKSWWSAKVRTSAGQMVRSAWLVCGVRSSCKAG